MGLASASSMVQPARRAESTASVAELVVAELIGAGTPSLAGLPGGGSNTDLVQAAGEAGLRFVLTSTDNGGALLAAAQAEIAGVAGACLMTLGPGVASAVNGVAQAALDRAPLLVITDELAPSLSGIVEHQIIDQRALLRPLVKASFDLNREAPDRTVREALALATTGRPGPVHLSCAGQVTRYSAVPSAGTPAPIEAPSDLPPTGLSPAARDALRHSHKPLALIGLGACRPADAEAVRAFCRRRQIPALVTYKAKGIIPDADPLLAGILTNGVLESPLIGESDLLLAIGLDPVELLPKAWAYPQPLIYLGRWPIAPAPLRATAQLVGDIAGSLGVIEGELAHGSEWRIEDVGQTMGTARAELWSDWPGFGPADVARRCADALPAARVTVDAGAHMLPVMELWPATAPRRMLISNGLSTMGFALPAAIGAAVIDGDAPVVAFTGDGGLLIAAGELATLARERLRVICVVFADRSLSLIRIKQELQGWKPRGEALGTTDWARLGESFGLAGYRCTTPGELDGALAGALAHAGPSLIECCIDPSGYAAALKKLRG